MDRMNDPFQRKTAELGSPARDLVPATPSDAVNETFIAISFRANTAGTVSFVTYDGTTRTIDVVAGETVPVAVRRINTTGTTATIHLYKA